MLVKNIQLSKYPDSIKPFEMALSNTSGQQKMIVANESNLNTTSTLIKSLVTSKNGEFIVFINIQSK